MTIEEIEELIRQYHAASMKVGVSGYIVEAAKNLYGYPVVGIIQEDYFLLDDCRQSYKNLIEAIKQYKEQS